MPRVVTNVLEQRLDYQLFAFKVFDVGAIQQAQRACDAQLRVVSPRQFNDFREVSGSGSFGTAGVDQTKQHGENLPMHGTLAKLHCEAVNLSDDIELLIHQLKSVLAVTTVAELLTMYSASVLVCTGTFGHTRCGSVAPDTRRTGHARRAWRLYGSAGLA
jgi:hypothetical protein